MGNVYDVASVPVTDAAETDAPDAVDLTSTTFLEAEKRRLYVKLSTGYDRSAAILFSAISKELRELRTCENHWTEDDLRRLCASLNGLWLRQLEIAERELKQTGCLDAPRVLDKAIERVRIQAATLE